MRYRQRVKITRSAGQAGAQDRTTGVWTPGVGSEPTTIYDDIADVQDKGEVLSRDPDGNALLTSDGMIYLGDQSKIADVRKGDAVEITWEDASTARAEVLLARRLDAAVAVRFLQRAA